MLDVHILSFAHWWASTTLLLHLPNAFAVPTPRNMARNHPKASIKQGRKKFGLLKGVNTQKATAQVEACREHGYLWTLQSYWTDGNEIWQVACKHPSSPSSLCPFRLWRIHARKFYVHCIGGSKKVTGSLILQEFPQISYCYVVKCSLCLTITDPYNMKPQINYRSQLHSIKKTNDHQRVGRIAKNNAQPKYKNITLYNTPINH